MQVQAAMRGGSRLGIRLQARWFGSCKKNFPCGAAPSPQLAILCSMAHLKAGSKPWTRAAGKLFGNSRPARGALGSLAHVAGPMGSNAARSFRESGDGGARSYPAALTD